VDLQFPEAPSRPVAARTVTDARVIDAGPRDRLETRPKIGLPKLSAEGL
jgi:hypothetical protein